MEDGYKSLDTAEWVADNIERVQAIRDKVALSFKEVSARRKEKLVKNSVMRKFKVGDSVLLRIPGIDGKLVAAWEGPYEIGKVVGPVTYELDLGSRRTRLAHVNTIKKFEENSGIKKVMSILEEEQEKLTVTNNKFKIVGNKLEKVKEGDVKLWCQEFEDVLTDWPGLMDVVKFTIDTGDSPPIAQHPYSIPVTLKEGVDKEIEWLLSKGYIRKSESLWASTVRKPNGKVRLCVDFKHINAVTQPLPFYLPKKSSK